MADYADLEIGLHRNEAGAYLIEFRFSLPKSDADTRSSLGSVKFDMEALAGLLHDPEAYGRVLTAQFFANQDAKTAFDLAVTSAQNQNAALRLRLMIGPGAHELHNLRWELLCNPQDNLPLATNQNIIFSRYLTSFDWRPVRLKSKGVPKVLAAVASPSDVARLNLSNIDSDEEWGTVKQCFNAMNLSTCQGKLTDIISFLRTHPVDILHIVCHGYIAENGQAILCLEDDNGKLDLVLGSYFVQQLKELQNRPRLVVLVSCQSAGKGVGDALTAIGPRLAEIGIPAVLAMQGNLSMSTARKFLPAFFEALERDDQIDLALSIARCSVRKVPDYWVPVLFMRLKSGRLWYTPGFSKEPSESDFINEVERIDQQLCTPIIGPGLLEPLIGSTSDIARLWAEKFRYPLSMHDQDVLPKVAQFVSTKKGAAIPFLEYTSYVGRILTKTSNTNPQGMKTTQILNELEILAKTIGEKDRANNELNAYRILARLPFTIYLVANPDCLLEDALREVGRKPEAILSPWNDSLSREKTIYDREPDYEPSRERPLIFYLFGRWNHRKSMVLTEDEYIKYLIGYTRNTAFISPDIRSALSETLLLFLGFQTDDWAFRVILHIILEQAGSVLLRDHVHVSAQIEPEDDRIIEPLHARKYLEEYLKGANINIFWGKAEEYLEKLIEKWNEQPYANTGF